MSQMIEPLVSVVMGVHNGAQSLRSTLASILSQGTTNFELIVVNDGSTDETPEILDLLTTTDARVRVIHQKNAGLTNALIRGCAEARADLIARQDCGDRSAPGRLAIQMNWLREHPEVVVVGSAFRTLGPRDETLGHWRPTHTDQELTAILRSGDSSVIYGPHHGSVMFRKTAYNKVGGYRSQFYFAQDLDLWTRMSEVGIISILATELYEVEFTYSSITARHGLRQRALRDLIAEATRLRSQGRSDDSVLERAKLINPDQGTILANDIVAIDYFIGSCLVNRRDPRAFDYFWRVVRRKPYLLKAWVKMLASRLRLGRDS